MFVAQRKWNDFVVNGGQELFVQRVFSMLHFGKVFCLNWSNFLTKSLLQNLHIHDLNMGYHDYIFIKSPRWYYFLLAVYPADRIEHLSKCIIIEHQLCRSACCLTTHLPTYCKVYSLYKYIVCIYYAFEINRDNLYCHSYTGVIRGF